MTTESDLQPARDKVETAPSDAQKEAGNYAKGHVKLHGLDVAIENPKGSIRTGKYRDTEWSVRMPADYGYVKRSTGADGDQVDVFIGPNPPSSRVFVIDQMNPGTQRFDEVKAIFGTGSREEAEALYDASFSDNKGSWRRMAITEVTPEEFKQWLAEGDAKRPFSRSAVARGLRGKEKLAAPAAPKEAQWLADLRENDKAVSPGGATYSIARSKETILDADRMSSPVEKLNVRYQTPAGKFGYVGDFMKGFASTDEAIAAAAAHARSAPAAASELEPARATAHELEGLDRTAPPSPDAQRLRRRA